MDKKNMSCFYNFISIFGFKVFSDNLSKIPIDEGKCRVINCSISPNNYGLAFKDSEFNQVLKDTDFLVLDGVYFALASLLLLGKNIKRNQGPDVFRHFCERLNYSGGRCFFLGSSLEVLERIKTRMNKDYPNVQIGYYSPPYKAVFSSEDNEKMIMSINSFNPDVLFVGMTAPKQEKWSISNRGNLNANLVISIGNVFDWFAGTQKSIHPLFFRLRIAWLVRIIIRPEIFKRNIGNQMLFFWHLALVVLRIKQPPA